MVWEESPEAFWERFAEHAVGVELMPLPANAVVLEVVTPQGVLYPFDRGAPPPPSGRAEVVLHAVVSSFRHLTRRPGLQQEEGGRHLVWGRVLRDLGDGFYLVNAGLPLVLASAEPLEVGADLELRTEPPLMAFRDEGSAD